jgi:hypothetical protein
LYLIYVISLLDMYNSAGTGQPAAGSGGNWTTNSWGPSLTNSGSGGSSEYCRSYFNFFFQISKNSTKHTLSHSHTFPLLNETFLKLILMIELSLSHQTTCITVKLAHQDQECHRPVTLATISRRQQTSHMAVMVSKI